MITKTIAKDGVFDQALQTYIVSVIAGGCAWSDSDHVAFSTTLGSCVSVCVTDTHRGVGGINHFLLPEDKDEANTNFSASFRYGSAAIENLLNALYAQGAAKNGLTIKIFGGAKVLNKVSRNVGEDNVTFTRRFFQRENLRVTSEDVGGEYGRQLVFFPRSGRALVRKVGQRDALNNILVEERSAYQHAHIEEMEAGDVELFDL